MTGDGPVGLTAAFVIDSGGRAAPLARRLGAVRRPLGDRLVCGWVYGEARTNADDAGFSTVEAVEDGWWYTAPLPGQRRALAYFTDADLPAAQLPHDRGMLVASATATAAIGPLIDECAFVPLRGGIRAAHSSVSTARVRAGLPPVMRASASIPSHRKDCCMPYSRGSRLRRRQINI
jgi:hypothetical protein